MAKNKKSSKKKENSKEKKESKKNDEELTPKELQSLIEKNLKWSQVIYKQNKKLKSRMTLMVIGNYLRLLLIFVPIILGVVYLVPVFNDAFKKYEPFFERFGAWTVQNPAEQSVTDRLSGKDIDTLIKELQEYKETTYETQQEN